MTKSGHILTNTLQELLILIALMIFGAIMTLVAAVLIIFMVFWLMVAVSYSLFDLIKTNILPKKHALG